MNQPPAPELTALELREVFCLYPLPAGGGTVAALRGLSMVLGTGERLVVQGPNGSGKTTLLRVLMGEMRPNAGSARLAGIDLSSSQPSTLSALRRNEIGVIDQHSARALRPELSVCDNVALQLRLAGGGKKSARQSARQMLGRLELEHLAARRIASLSGGEAQRVAIAAALTHRPHIVLADEPTGELDAETADGVYDLLAAAVAEIDASMVLVSHDPRAARIADRVVRIRDGRLSEQWSPQTPQDEALVIDSRGWLRLPDQLRQNAGAPATVRALLHEGRIVLEPTNLGQPQLAQTETTARSAPSVSTDGVLARMTGVGLHLGGRPVIYELDLTVSNAEMTVISGRSGSGKSTLLLLLLGLLDPDAGQIVLGGSNLAGLDRAARAELRRQCTAVSTQNGSLAESMNARENIAFSRAIRGLPSDDSQVEDLIVLLDLQSVADRQLRMLSGGERQRTALARCLAAQRPLIVLDEPTSQQDEAHVELVAEVLRAAAVNGTGILCATHDPIVMAAASRVVTLSA